MGRIECFVATYPGGERFLKETVDSLNGQDVPVAVYVMNDTRLPHEKWNQALDEATAEYVALPHHDDIYLPGWARELSGWLDAHPTAAAVFCLDYLIDDNGKRIGQTYPAWDDRDVYTFRDLFDLTMRHGNVLRCETVMFNRAVLGDLRFPDREVSGTAHDTQFWFEIAARHTVGIVMKPLVKYRVHPDSDTQKNVVAKDPSIDHIRAMMHASTLRPQDVDFQHVIGLAKALSVREEVAEANRVRERASAGGCELLVCHEPPDNAGTGVVVARRVRELNRHPDGRLRYYVQPVDGSTVDIVWERGCPVVRCPPGAFGDVIGRMTPDKIEYHHLLRWPLDVLNAPCGNKELWLHDSFLWCDRWHSVHRDGFVCDGPESAKCADCSGASREQIDRKRKLLMEALPGMKRFVANSAYTADAAKRHLGVECEIVFPEGEPLFPKPPSRRVGYFGGFGIVKGTHVLLKAWRMLNGKDATLLLFCDVPKDWLCGGKIAGYDNVLVMGPYNRGDLPDLVHLVDIAVVPSINESYGMVLRELQALGKKVVATDAGGMGGIGTVRGNDPAALAEAIREALI